MKIIQKMKTLMIFTLIFVFVTISAAQRDITNIEVTFKKNTDSATYKQQIRGYDVIDYSFRASEGQSAEIDLEAKNNALYFNLLDTATMLPIETDPMPREVREWSGVLPKTGSYKIRIYLIRAEARRNKVAPFTLNLRITGSLDDSSQGIMGNYVTEGYSKRNDGYDWAALSVTPVNKNKVKVKVRSRADRKKPTCTFDGNADPVDAKTLKYYGNNLVIVFSFSGDSVSITTEKPENRDKLGLFCSGGGSLAGEYSKIVGELDKKQIDKTAYRKMVEWGKYAFVIQVEENTLSIRPIGLEIDNREVKHQIKGSVMDAETGELNNDSYPEVLVYITSKESSSYGSVIGYSVNNGKSMSQIFIPDVNDIPEGKDGYRGGDEFAIVESTFVQRFPIYKIENGNVLASGDMRQIQYKLRDGEASRRLVVDKILNYPVPGQTTSSLIGKWHWKNLDTPVGSTNVAKPGNYTLEFLADGGVRVLADCNRGTGTYEASGSSLKFSPIASTRMACPSGSLDSLFLKSLDAARIFKIDGNELSIDLLADGGTMKFTRRGR